METKKENRGPFGGGNDNRDQKPSFKTRIMEFLQRTMSGIASLDYQHESRRRLFGLPYLSINIGPHTPEGMRHARGIIAIGTKATGVIAIGLFVGRGVFAMGLLAVGLATVGVAAAGIVVVAVFGVGVVAVSVVAFGYLAVGILAVGYKSVGIVAFGSDALGLIARGETADAVFPLKR